MILIYYKNAAGELCGYMCPAKGWTLRQLKEEIGRFNKTCGGGCKAYARLVPNRTHQQESEADI